MRLYPQEILKGTTVKSSFSEWVKDNAFSIFNIVVLVAAFAYQQGATNVKSAMFEDRMVTAEKKIEDMDRIGHPAHEARIASLERKTDDLAVLKNIVQTQSENIRQLTETVKSDHDILLRYVTAAEAKK